MMQEAQKYIYHCNHCGQLFESLTRIKQHTSCSLCGKNPHTPSFTSLAELPAAEKTNKADNRGVPGKDEADFVSMRKKKRSKRWNILYITWLAGLAGIAIFSYYLNKESNTQSQLSSHNNNALQQYAARKQEALQQCANNFLKFAIAPSIQSKSFYILNGSDIILDIHQYQTEKFTLNDIYRSKFVSFELMETGEHHKALARMRYSSVSVQAPLTDSVNTESESATDTDIEESSPEIQDATTNSEAPPADNKNTLVDSVKTQQPTNSSFDFEMVFWLHDGKWLIDWQQYVRFCETNWLKFTENKKINSAKRFRIYARQAVTESSSIDGYTEYKFSEAENNSSSPVRSPRSVYINNQSPEKEHIRKAFETLESSKNNHQSEYQPALGAFDPPNSTRLEVTLDHQKIGDKIVLVVKEVHRTDWQTPPSKAETISN